MHSTPLILEEPIRMASVLEPSKPATFDCLMKTYAFLTPDLWRETRFAKSPYQEHTDFLSKPIGKILIEDVERVEA